MCAIWSSAAAVAGRWDMTATVAAHTAHPNAIVRMKDMELPPKVIDGDERNMAPFERRGREK
jgi:hypothetical protein